MHVLLMIGSVWERLFTPKGAFNFVLLASMVFSQSEAVAVQYIHIEISVFIDALQHRASSFIISKTSQECILMVVMPI